MPTVRLPAPFVAYGCQRSLVCCHHPLRAPMEVDDEERIGKVLASSEAGRAYLPILASVEQVNGLRVFKQVDERCVHLRAPPRHEPPPPAGAQPPEVGCSLQFIAGVEALAPACRNYPRWVVDIPPRPGSEAEVEVIFLLACPSAAALLVKDPAPFRFAEVPRETWRYPPTREVGNVELDMVADLREGWWRALSDGRDDAEQLASVLSYMFAAPLTPPRRALAPSAPSDALLEGFAGYDVGFIHDALERLPGTSPTYGGLHWDLRHDLTRTITARELLDALDIAPQLLFALVDQLVPIAGIHDSRPPHKWMRTAVRRALAVARAADSLIARVPFGIDKLFTDLITAVTHLDASETPSAV